jgi:hypothetical protein
VWENHPNIFIPDGLGLETEEIKVTPFDVA